MPDSRLKSVLPRTSARSCKSFEALGAMEVAQVNLPVAMLIWLMILSMLLKIDFRSLQEVRQHPKGVGVTLFINWAVKPFSMALLAWIVSRSKPWYEAAGITVQAASAAKITEK